MFTPNTDPGSNFFELAKRVGAINPSVFAGSPLDIPHATTCAALRYEGGVLIAGDRRATSGNWISHRAMEKVVQSDDFSAVAISGAAGPAMEMIKLFQLQLEHYEKMEGRPLTLEGKANQLSMMLRGNLPAAMQGLAVVPLFAGFEPLESAGHIWDYDVTGGRYEEREYVTIGSGSMHAGTVIKVGWRSDLNETQAIELACRSLWEAADADSATGGPDILRQVYPIVAVIDANGWRRIDDAELATIFANIQEEVRRR
jgi:proteasome beta subunit